MIFTNCCNHEFIGDNHSPIQPDGYCLNCGFHPEIEELKKENEEMREALKWALNTLPHVSIDKDSYTKVIDFQNKFNLSETPNSSKEGV